MRLSGLMVAAVLILPLALFAQHSSGGGGSISSSSSGSHSGGSSSGSSGGSSHASGGGGASHSSSGAHSSSSHASSSHASSGGSRSGSTRTASASSSRSTASLANLPPSRPGAKPTAATKIDKKNSPAHKTGLSQTAQPEKRSFFSFLRHPFGRPKAKSVDATLAEADLRRPVCKKGPCKEPAPKPVPPVESNLRKPVCKGKECGCPPGEAAGKNGACVAAPVNNIGVCGAGEYWNGGACLSSAGQCSANEYWNGASCMAPQAQCGTLDARAAMLASEVRGARAQMQSACANNSSAMDCSNLKVNYDGAIERYRMLLNEAPANCRALLPDPLSL